MKPNSCGVQMAGENVKSEDSEEMSVDSGGSYDLSESSNGEVQTGEVVLVWGT